MVVIKGLAITAGSKPSFLAAIGSILPTTLAKNTAMNSVSPYLSEGEATVGTLLNIKHLSATPIGCTVSCESELVEIDGRRLVFRVTARDSAGLIGEGTHERFIISAKKFMDKTKSKLSKI